MKKLLFSTLALCVPWLSTAFAITATPLETLVPASHQSVHDVTAGNAYLSNDNLSFTADLSLASSRVRANVPASGMPQLFGAVISSTSLSPGVYEIPSNGESEFVKQKLESSTYVVNATDGATRAGNRYYSIYSEELMPGWSFYYVDAWGIGESEWSRRWYGKEADANIVATDFAEDPVTKVLYGSLSDGDGGYELCTVKFPDYKTRDITRDVVGSLSTPLYAMAVSGDGVLYALTSEGTLVSVDKQTAATTTIGSSGLSLSGKGSGVIDPTTGKFYCTASLSDGTSGVYEINLSGGDARLVYSFPGNEQVVGLYCNPSEAVAAAPGKATSLRADFPEGALSGTLSFNAPQTDANGNAAQGALNYTVSAGAETLASGATEYGASVSVPLSFATEGEYTLSVVMSSEGGTSEASTLQVRVGKGLPKSPQIIASWDGSVMHLSWNAVTESADGGYINPAEVTYSVTRKPDGRVVASHTSATSADDVIGEPDKFTVYSYEIVAEYGDKVSAASESAKVGVGAYSVPYNEDFGVDFYRNDLLSTYTIVDANDDGEGWQYNSYTEVMRCRTMNAGEGADDWLFMPALKLEKGMAYELSAYLKDGGSTLQERFEVKMGRGCTPADMTKTVIEEQYVQSDEMKEYKAYLNPDADGDWYIGFHCTTPESAYYLYLDDIQVVAKADAGLPQPPTNFTAVADENGAHKVSLSLEAPLKDVSGNALSDMERVVILRDGVEIKSYPSPTPGKVYTYEDLDVPAGNHNYKALAYNKCGKGDVALVSVFVGIHKPSHPTNVTACETATNGEVAMTWSAVTTDENGKEIPASAITYSVVRLNQQGGFDQIYKEGLTDTEYTFEAVPEGEQAFINFAVFAHTEGGYSKGAIAPQIAVGTPYSLPWRESFENYGSPSYPFSVATLAGSGTWIAMDDDKFVDMKSHDGDSGYVAMAGSAEGDKASLTSAKISLKDVVNPVFSFYVYNMAGDWGDDDNVVEVEIGTAGKYTSVYNKPNYESGMADKWNLVAIPLNDYVGKDIQIRLSATCNHAIYTVIDELELKPYALDDLRAVAFTSPDRVIANKPVVITAEVENNGMNAAKGGAVVLYANGNAYMRKELEELAFGKSAYVDFDCTINPSFGKSVDLQVKVDLNGDVNPNNDRTESRTLALEQTLLPAPGNLKAESVSGGLSLSWTAPSMDNAVAARVVEDFENSPAWSSDVDGWTFHDIDGLGINGFDGVNFPGIPDGSAQSFWVMDDRLEDLNNTFAAYSGHKYLANMNVNSGETDDWAVSPELCGMEQTISFKAKSYNWMFPESFNLLVSESGTDPSDFTEVATYDNVPWEWTEYSYTLPAGSKYFAIQSNYSDGVMLFIDDVSYVPSGKAESLELKGYNVYCDGILETKQPLSSCSYQAGGYNPAGHTYAVTAVYDKGESGPSNLLTPSSVADVEVGNVSVSVSGNTITVIGAEGEPLTVSGADGTIIYKAERAASRVMIPAHSGIYIVKAGANSVKVIVR